MAGPSTSMTTLNPGAGWVQVAAGPIASYFMIRHFPKHIPILITAGTATPAANSPGLRSDEGEFWSQGAVPTGTNLYARVSNNTNGPVSISVFQN